MSINFPNNPAPNSEWTDQNGNIWIWHNNRWRRKIPTYGPAAIDIHRLRDFSLDPAGAPDGAKTSFELFSMKSRVAVSPVSVEQVAIFDPNGNRLVPGTDYTVTGDHVTFTNPPAAGDRFFAQYYAIPPGAAGGIDDPLDHTILQRYVFDPEQPGGGARVWADGRNQLQIVPTVNRLNSRGLLPVSHLEQGSVVLVQDTGQLYRLLVQPASMVNTMSDWQLISGTGGVKYAARLASLPTARTRPKVEDGSLYVVRLDFEGKPLYRLISWDASIRGVADKSTLTPIAWDPLDIIADATDFTTVINNGNTTEGRWYVIDDPNGITPLPSEPYAGVHLPVGTKLIDCGDPQKGRGGWIVAAPDVNYTPGTTPTLPAATQIDDLTKPTVDGGWRFLNRETFVNQLAASADHPLDNQKGDFQTVVERGKAIIKVFDGTSWQTLFDEQQIKGWIASLALFRGTVSEDPTQHPGTITWTDLPDLVAMSAAKDKSRVGAYWIWAGQDPLTVVGGAAGTATPKIGTDLAGATLHVGDWLVIADQGTGNPGDVNEVSLHWVRVGGDLLTKSRGVNLFGLKNWVAGSYEQDSLVVQNGSVYRARVPVVPTDAAPGVRSGVVIPAVGFANPITQDPTKTISNKGDMEQFLLDDPKPAQWTAYPIGTGFGVGAAVRQRLFQNQTMAAGDLLVWTGVPNFSINSLAAPPQVVSNGWVLVPGGGATATLKNDVRTQMIAVAGGNKWDRVPISGALKFLTDETGLPVAGNLGDSYLILVSPTYGTNNSPAIVTWDQGAARWVTVSGGGSGGTAMDFTQSDLLVSVGCPIGSIVMWACAPATIPRGWLELNGQPFDPVAYPELAVLFPNNEVPDLRNNFVRMWGPGRALNLQRQQWTTGPPRNQFYSSTSGAHTHHITANVEAGVPGPSYEAGRYHMGPSNTDHDGDHSHAITGGGDPETAPDHVVLGFIIKAKEGSAVLSPPALNVPATP